MIELIVSFLLSLPSVDETPEVLADQVAAAQIAATPELPVELLLAIGWVESRFDPTATSMKINGVRRTGPWRSTKRPRGTLRSMHCGISQATARTWAECLALRDPDLAYIALVDSLERWMKFSRGNLSRALAGYGCGVKGARTGRCNRYPARVLFRQRQIARAIAAGGVS